MTQVLQDFGNSADVNHCLNKTKTGSIRAPALDNRSRTQRIEAYVHDARDDNKSGDNYYGCVQL